MTSGFGQGLLETLQLSDLPLFEGGGRRAKCFR